MLKMSNVEDWQKRYILMASISGKVHFVNTLQENQSLRNGTELMYIGGSTGQYFGEVYVPQINAGKVKINQKVLIKFQGYPFEEYGAVEGQIKSISQVPTTDNLFFIAIVSLPNDLKSNSNKQLSYKSGMEASAEIITEDLRLVERIFYQLKRTLGQR
jgi:HlyD family secretion protein